MTDHEHAKKTLARALSDLAHQLFKLTVSDIEAATHKPVTHVHL